MTEILYKEKIDKQPDGKSLLKTILKLRGIKDVESFLNPQSPLDFSLSDFGFKKKEINKIIKKLIKLHKEQKMIVVYCDYDADGITGGAVMWETLYLLGFKVMPYVPDRKLEGYGFSKAGLDNVKKKYNPDLIISVDHGITAKKQVEYAKKLGIEVVVTDHHHRQEDKFPSNALAVFHISELSGSGASYFAAKEIFTKFKMQSAGLAGSPRVEAGRQAKCKVPKSNLIILERNFQSEYMSIASIGTVADLVPLVGQSRNLVFHGLKNFSKIKRPGIVQILNEAKIQDRQITPYEIGYIIAPRINAVGRLKHAIDALRLLCTNNLQTAKDLASQIGDINVRRQDMVKDAASEAISQVSKIKNLPNLIILKSESWHEGIIGLIAGKILEEYYRPTIVMTRGDGFYKASVRSIPEFHITEFLSKFKKYLTNYGGHAAAAGFTIPAENLEGFIKEATKLADRKISKKMLVKKIESDIYMPVSFASKEIYKAIEKLNPFGIGNSKPTFYSEVTIAHAGTFGKKGDHLKLIVKNSSDEKQGVEMIVFGEGGEFKNLSRNQPVKIVYQIDLNIWNARESLRGIVRHLEL